jgi:DnaK suppressor protein
MLLKCRCPRRTTVSRHKLGVFRQQLLQVLDNLERPLLEDLELHQEGGIDPTDEAQARMSVDVTAQTLDIEWHKQRAIHAALDKLDSGEYGVCESCGQKIPPKRLRALPWATHCTACQLREEAEADSVKAYHWAA